MWYPTSMSRWDSAIVPTHSQNATLLHRFDRGDRKQFTIFQSSKWIAGLLRLNLYSSCFYYFLLLDDVDGQCSICYSFCVRAFYILYYIFHSSYLHFPFWPRWLVLSHFDKFFFVRDAFLTSFMIVNASNLIACSSIQVCAFSLLLISAIFWFNNVLSTWTGYTITKESHAMHVVFHL